MPRDSFLDQYTKKAAKANKNDKPKATYRFCYVNKAERICLNTIKPVGQAPHYVLWDGKHLKEGLKEFRTPEGDLLQLPPMDVPFYRDIYKKIIFPDCIADLATNEQIDSAITGLISRKMILDHNYLVIARNFIKFSWIYERFNITPSLYLYGDYGTGKTSFGKWITWLSQYGQVMNKVTVAAMVRILDNSNSSIMLDEGDYLDGDESDNFRMVLRNGYERGGNYIITESEGRNHVPRSFLIDQPKVISKRQWGKDDALASRMIPIRMTPKDQEIPESMRKNDEIDQTLAEHAEMREVTNMLLRWRMENIFKFAPPVLIDGMRIRFNDTVSPLLKVANESDKKVLINYMVEFERSTKVDVSDQFNIRIFRVVGKMYEELKNYGPTTRIFLTDVSSRCIEDYGKEMSDTDAKRAYSSRAIKSAMKNLGLESELYANKVYLRWDSVEKMVPIIAQKYGITFGDEEGPQPLPNQTIKDPKIDEKQDLFSAAQKQEEAEALLAEHEAAGENVDPPARTLAEEIKDEDEETTIDPKDLPF